MSATGDRTWRCCAYADISGNKIALHNIRNCDYRTETDFDVRRYHKTIDLEKIRTADLFMG